MCQSAYITAGACVLAGKTILKVCKVCKGKEKKRDDGEAIKFFFQQIVNLSSGSQGHHNMKVSFSNQFES